MPTSALHPASQLALESQAAQELLDLLKREQAQLMDADIDALTALTAEKSRVVARLSELGLARHQALAAAGFATTETGMQQWISAHATVNDKPWNLLLNTMRSAKEMNRTNGILIHTHLGRNQSALNVLQSGSPSGSMYGADGQSSVRPASRGLIVG